MVASVTPAFSLCVYCGSRLGLDPTFAACATSVGQWIGSHGGQLVYGGGNVGLMGALADGALSAGGEVIGVIPHKLMQRELAHRGLSRLEVVADMAERKTRMIAISDAFVALPGGLGTLDELFEVLTLAQVGYHRKPMVVHNQAAYWDGLLAVCRSMADSGFVYPGELALLRSCGTIEDTLDATAQD